MADIEMVDADASTPACNEQPATLMELPEELIDMIFSMTVDENGKAPDSLALVSKKANRISEAHRFPRLEVTVHPYIGFDPKFCYGAREHHLVQQLIQNPKLGEWVKEVRFRVDRNYHNVFSTQVPLEEPDQEILMRTIIGLCPNMTTLTVDGKPIEDMDFGTLLTEMIGNGVVAEPDLWPGPQNIPLRNSFDKLEVLDLRLDWATGTAAEQPSFMVDMLPVFELPKLKKMVLKGMLVSGDAAKDFMEEGDMARWEKLNSRLELLIFQSPQFGKTKDPLFELMLKGCKNLKKLSFVQVLGFPEDHNGRDVPTDVRAKLFKWMAPFLESTTTLTSFTITAGQTISTRTLYGFSTALQPLRNNTTVAELDVDLDISVRTTDDSEWPIVAIPYDPDQEWLDDLKSRPDTLDLVHLPKNLRTLNLNRPNTWGYVTPGCRWFQVIAALQALADAIPANFPHLKKVTVEHILQLEPWEITDPIPKEKIDSLFRAFKKAGVEFGIIEFST